MLKNFRVVNWGKFQHYKHRHPPWIKMHNTILSDYRFTQLPDKSRSHLVSIWVLASKLDNKIPYDSKWVQSQISAHETVDLLELVNAGFIKACRGGASNPLAACQQSADSETETEKSRVEGTARKRASKRTLVSKEIKDQADDVWQYYVSEIARPGDERANQKARAMKNITKLLQNGTTAEELCNTVYHYRLECEDEKKKVEHQYRYACANFYGPKAEHWKGYLEREAS